MQVKLEWYEVAIAGFVGTLRRTESIRNNLNGQGKGGHQPDWKNEIDSVCAEIAVGKGLNIYWAGTVNTFKDPDLGEYIQVRQTPKSHLRLIVRPNDNEDHIYVLVTGTTEVLRCPVFEIKGWISGKAAKEVGEWMNPGGQDYAWFVDQKHLRPIYELQIRLIQEAAAKIQGQNKKAA